MPRKWKTVFFLLCWLLPAAVFCQNFPLQHFTTENGLPSNTTYSVYRDSKGFLWIGTDKGVVRYNGIEFEKFNTDDGLPDNDIFFFLEDHEGRLWLSTYNGELCFYNDGVFHTGANTPFLKKSVKYSFISWMELEKDSSVTISFGDRLAFLNIHHDTCRSFSLKADKLPTGEPALFINKITADRYSILCPDQSFIIDTASNYIPNTLRQNAGHFRASLAQDVRYIFSDKGAYSADQVLKMKFGSTLATSFVYTIYNCGATWLTGTSNGLFINNDKQILKGNRVNNITQDIEGNFWITTLDNGLFCMAKDYENILEYDSVYTGAIKYAGTAGRYLFFTTGNGNFYRFENGKAILLFDYFKHFGRYFKGENAMQNYIGTNQNGQGVSNNYRYYNLELNFSYAIDKINTNNPAVTLLKKEDKTDIAHIKELFFGKQKIFIRNSDFISEIDKPGVESGRSLNVRKIGTNMRGKRIFGMALAPGDILWYSSFEKVNKIIDSVTLPQQQFGNITFKWMQIAGSYAVGITHNNQLLVCRDFETRNIIVDSIAAAGFVWDKLYKLNDTTFLVSTNTLYRLLTLHTAGAAPGYTIQVIENNAMPAQAEYICNNDSFCYFFKKGTVTSVPVNALVIKHKTPEIFFKSVKTRNNTYHILSGAPVNISYSEAKNINISFSPFSFGGRSLICEYSISKDTTEYWRQVKDNEINLFDPSFGSYTVKVRARTLSGPFSKSFEFSFTIAKPFWATYWFITACILLFIAIVLLALRTITKRNTRKRELAHSNEIKYLKSEYKALNALMNPHFIFNTLNNVQWLVNNDDKLTANHYLRVFSDLVRQNMNNITKELIPLSNEIELVNNYLKLEKLRFKDALNYEIIIDELLDMDSVKVPPLLIQPLVENAIKHGLLPGTAAADNLLKMHIYRKEDKLYIDITDNGIGFNESQKKARSLHKSTGIENIRKRIEKLSLMQNIHISLTITELHEHGIPSGTRATICIDLNEE